MDQGTLVCREVDEAVVPELQRQPGAASAIRDGMQPEELPASVGAAEVREALVVEDATGEADHERGQSGSGCEVRNVPNGRSGGAV